MVCLCKTLFIHLLRRRGQGFIGVKLDMQKANNKVEWRFIVKVLELFVFYSQFVRWIEQCIIIASFQVLINGNPSSKFYPRRGLCQRDPFSLYLFIICSKILSQLLLSMEEEKRIHGIKIAWNSPSISHLVFANDVTFFIFANMYKVQHLLHCLDK